ERQHLHVHGAEHARRHVHTRAAARRPAGEPDAGEADRRLPARRRYRPPKQPKVVTRMLRRLRGEEGIALVMALMVLTVLTIVIGTTILASTQSQHESGYTKAKSYAYGLAENGVNDAMSVLRVPPDPLTGIGKNARDPNVFCGLSLPSTWSYNPVGSCTIKSTFDGGYVLTSA